MKKAVFLLLMLLSAATFSAIYINHDESGGIEYTDSPSDTTNKVELPAINAVNSSTATNKTTQTAPANTAPSSNTPSTANTYLKLEIKSPKNGATLSSMDPITVEMDTDPALRLDDKVQLVVDQQPVGTASSKLDQRISNIEKGKHMLSAEIISSDQQVLMHSATIMIEVK